MNKLELVDAPPARANKIGFFGKVPTHGDFVSKGFDHSLLSRLDAWIGAGLECCERELGPAWVDRFRRSPPWRFVIDRSLWSEAAMVGVLLPSRDRVGRHFPLVIAASVESFRGSAAQLCFDDKWFMAAEALAETSLHQDFDTSTLGEGLNRLGMPRVRVEPGSTIGGGKPVSLWWHLEAETKRADGFATQGKPVAEDFLRLVSFAGTRAPMPSQSSQPVVRDPEDAGPATADDEKKTDVGPFPSVARSFATHAGTRRDVNADSLLVSRAPCLFAIADGAGNGTMAANAAKVTTNALSQVEAHESLDQIVQDVKGKLGRAHSILQANTGFETSVSLSASVAALVLSSASYSVLWAGDVRCYLLRNCMMRALTRDHTQVGLRTTLSRSVGGQGPLVPEIVTGRWQPGDRFLLCSSGLLKALGERAIADSSLNMPLEEAAISLVQDALIEHAEENISAIVVEVSL
jgi:type VI secretion system protein ImpM